MELRLEALRFGWILAPVAAASLYAFAALLPASHATQRLLAFDIYAQFYPNIAYAVASLKAGGGLLWNPFQSCGQPFFADIQTGLLYPLNWVFAFLPREAALLASVIGNLSIAGIGMFRLCRVLGLSVAACLCGMIVLQWSSGLLHLASWSPTHVGAYAWLSVAMWRTEVLVRRPDLRSALWLGGALSIQLLPGFPQFSMFTYQLILLRVGWELVRPKHPLRISILKMTGLALIMPIFLAAVQLLPSIELAANSVRGGVQSMQEIGPGIDAGYFGDHGLFNTAFPFGTFWIGPFLLAIAALWDARYRRMTGWLLATSILYFVLSFGPGTTLFEIYAQLPAGSLFRGPTRFLFIESFLLAGLAALGYQAILKSMSSAPSERRIGGKVLAIAAATAICMFAAPRLLQSSGLVVAIVIVFALLAAPFLHGRVMKAVFTFLLLGSVAGHLAVSGARPWQNLYAGELYSQHDQIFDHVGESLSAQDRVFIEGLHLDFSLTPKIAQMQRIPAAYDYQPQSLARFADYFVFMTGVRRNGSFNTWIYLKAGNGLLHHSALRPFRSRFLNGMAVRYLVLDKAVDRTATVPASQRWLKIEEIENVRVYENLDSLPRARFVHRLLREDAADPLLQLHKDGRLRPGTAVVAGFPADATMEYPRSGRGEVHFLIDEPEYLSLRVESPTPGFVLLADSYYPGWKATVDGVSVPIYRANYAFRLVPVPAGSTTLEFRYRPGSVFVGASVTVLSTILFACLWFRLRFSRQREPHDREEERSPIRTNFQDNRAI